MKRRKIPKKTGKQTLLQKESEFNRVVKKVYTLLFPDNKPLKANDIVVRVFRLNPQKFNPGIGYAMLMGHTIFVIEQEINGNLDKILTDVVETAAQTMWELDAPDNKNVDLFYTDIVMAVCETKKRSDENGYEYVTRDQVIKNSLVLSNFQLDEMKKLFKKYPESPYEKSAEILIFNKESNPNAYALFEKSLELLKRIPAPKLDPI